MLSLRRLSRIGRWATSTSLAWALGCNATSGDRTPRGPAPTKSADVDGCGGCHREAEAGWARSMHRSAFTSEDFQLSWAAEPRQFCVDCHAPQRATSGASGEARGVGCTDCHEVPAAHRVTATTPRPKASTRSCGSCHDFPVPGTRASFQSTVREHLASPLSDTPCVKCHMPVERGRPSHAFDVSRNRELLSRAVVVGAPRYDGGSVTFELRTERVGHRFPTGDIFRRVSVSLLATDDAGHAVCAETWHFNRDWGAHRDALLTRREEPSADSRLTHEPRMLRASCSRRPARARVVIDYIRGRSGDETSFVAFDQLELFDRTFPVPPCERFCGTAVDGMTPR